MKGTRILYKYHCTKNYPIGYDLCDILIMDNCVESVMKMKSVIRDDDENITEEFETYYVRTTSGENYFLKEIDENYKF